MTEDAERDEAIFARACCDEPDAFAELVRRHERLIHAITARIVLNREDARDLTQETFMTAWRKRDEFETTRSFKAWIAGIAANLARGEARRHYRGEEELPESDSIAALFSTPATRLEEKESAGELENAIMKLPPDYRAVISLKYLAEMSYREIEESLGISRPTLETRLFRARQALRNSLAARKEEFARG